MQPQSRKPSDGSLLHTALLGMMVLAALLGAWPQPLAAQSASGSDPYVIVLGIAQDGGAPQAGTKPGQPAQASTRHHVASLAIIDPGTGERWLVEATPDFPRQLRILDSLVPVSATPGLAGIFLTHAHIGHYAGLMYLGHEVMGASRVPVYAMPRMTAFLTANGPWSQLVRLGNVELRPIKAGDPVHLNARLTVTPLLVPHRQEYSEVVGFRIAGPDRTLLFIPDIDAWEPWGPTRLEDELGTVDLAFLDGTFYADGEVRGRDMSGFPHPRIADTMNRLAALPASERAKVRFIHLNHTNPALDPESSARRAVEALGFRVAMELERVGL